MPSPTETSDDPYLWLEEVEGARALAFVTEQNARTLAALTGPEFERDQEDFRDPFGTRQDPIHQQTWRLLLQSLAGHA